MADTGLLDEAILNNMIWCKTLLAAHGIASEIVEHHWTTNAAPPPFYGNLVTRTPDDGAQLARLQELIELCPKPGWGWKDSFARLSPGDGFELLFEAHWFGGRIQSAAGQAVRMETAEQLERWERAWQVESPAPGQRIFPPELLSVPDVAFLAVLVAGSIVGGAIANASGGVVGISNEFGRDCKPAAQALHPDRPLVGYDVATPDSFEELGPLRVWILA